MSASCPLHRPSAPGTLLLPTFTGGCLALLMVWVLALATPLRGQDPVAVALMTGFNPGSNPGMAQLESKLQLAFGGGGSGLPPFTSQVFAYTNTSGAAAFLAAAGPTARRVLIGHSFGASSNFSLAQNTLGPMGLSVALQISVDWVSQSSPFSATTPTLPTAILRAFNYHQSSTAFLEPVPANTILGAERNLNMEFVFADATLVHTSIDCDARVHEVILARVREIFDPQPFPASGDPLDLYCRRDTLNLPCDPGSGLALAGVLAEHPIQPVLAGQWITLRTIAPEGLFTAAPVGILGEVFASGTPPTPVLPGLASGLDPSALFLLTPGGVQAPPVALIALPASGFEISLCWPPGLSGISVLLQTVALAPTATNGVYATSSAIELRGL